MIEIKKDNIEKILAENETLILKFQANWCGPCKMLGPIFEELSKENEGVFIGNVNVDENSEIGLKYKVRGIPCVIALKNGQEIDGSRNVGLKPKSVYQELIDSIK